MVGVTESTDVTMCAMTRGISTAFHIREKIAIGVMDCGNHSELDLEQGC